MVYVGIGGTTRPNSSSERALRLCLDHIEAAGHEVICLAGEDLDLPIYDPTETDRTAKAQRLISALRRAQGIVVSSPAYHGTVSGMVKNALDYAEDLAHDERPYLDGLPVGTIATGYGWQATVNTLRTLRDIAHALRGWPTPYGAVLNSAGHTDAETREQALFEATRLVAAQVSDARHSRVPAGA